MSSTQQLVGVAGVGLIAVNAFTGKQRDALSPMWTGSGDLGGAHTVAKQLGLEVAGVAVLVIAAGSSDNAAHASLAIVAALWLVWLMFRPKYVAGTSKYGPLPGAGPLLPAPTGQGPTRTNLPPNTIPMPGMP